MWHADFGLNSILPILDEIFLPVLDENVRVSRYAINLKLYNKCTTAGEYITLGLLFSVVFFVLTLERAVGCCAPLE